MNVAFLLEDTAVSSRARTVLAYADALVSRGHRIRIVTADAPVRWRSSRAEWVYVEELTSYRRGGDELIIATGTGVAAVATAPAPTVQLCFGDEEPDTHSSALSKLAPSEAVAEVVRRNGGSAEVAGAIVDDHVYSKAPRREHEPLRVLVAGAYQNETNGVDDAYGAVAHARWFHQKLDLVRVSPWTPSREEPLDGVREFHVGLTTEEMGRLLKTCDVVISAAYEEKPFGLVPREAVAAGVPLLLSSTPGHVYDESSDYALFAPERNAVELGERLIELLSDSELRERLAVRGREVAQQWRESRVAERLETLLMAVV